MFFSIFFFFLFFFLSKDYIRKTDKEVSKKLAIETFIGSAELINQRNSSPKDLRKAVTSPGGTTEAGLNYLENINIDKIITQTIIEAVNRGNELSKESEY